MCVTTLVRSIVFITAAVFFSACGGSDSGSGAPAEEQTPDMGETSEDWVLTGTIVFEKLDKGIVEYHIDQDMVVLYEGDGLRPRRHPDGDKTIFMERGCNIPSVYSLAIGDENGLSRPVTGCSDSFTISGYTNRGYFHIQTAAISPDKSRLVMKMCDSCYNTITPDTQFFIVVLDLNGNFIKSWDNARDAAWSPDDGSLVISTVDNRIFTTDADLENEVYIDDGQFNGPIDDIAVHPTGDFFLFVHNGQIWRMNRDGSEAKVALKTEMALRSPAWSPAGEGFVVFAWDDIGVGHFVQLLAFKNIFTGEFIKIDLEDELGFMNYPWYPLSWAR